MDPKLVRMAKEIPTRLKDVMNSMFEQSQPALRSGVSALRDSLKRLDSYLSDVEKEHLHGDSGAARGAKGETGATPVRRRRRRGRFGTSEFIVNQLSQNAKGLRPVQIAEKLAEATGRDKSSALSNVNTTLGRLKAQGMARSADGIWSATGKAAAPAAPRAKRRSRRKKAAA